MDHGDCPVVSSKPSDPQQRRPDGRMYFVETAESVQSVCWSVCVCMQWIWVALVTVVSRLTSVESWPGLWSKSSSAVTVYTPSRSYRRNAVYTALSSRWTDALYPVRHRSINHWSFISHRTMLTIRELHAYVSQTRGQKRFTISEVAADWHEQMIARRFMRPSIVSVGEHYWTCGAASRHTISVYTSQLVVAWWRDGRSKGHEFDSRSGRYQVVTTWMGDCLRTGKPPRYITNHQGLLSLSSLRGR